VTQRGASPRSARHAIAVRPQRRRLQQRAVRRERPELLGKALARDRPQSRAGAAGKDDRMMRRSLMGPQRASTGMGSPKRHWAPLQARGGTVLYGSSVSVVNTCLPPVTPDAADSQERRSQNASKSNTAGVRHSPGSRLDADLGQTSGPIHRQWSSGCFTRIGVHGAS
jgi:hypothetical protein